LFYTDGAKCGIISKVNVVTPISEVTLPTEAECETWVATYYPNDYEQTSSNYSVDAFKLNIAIRESNGTFIPITCPEYFNGTLYFARDNFVYCSKTFDTTVEDIRFNIVAGFPHPVTMISRVTDGIYVGTEKHIYFLKGTGFNFNSKGILNDGFTQRQVSTFGVIKGSDVRVNSTLVPDAKAENTVVLCSTALGIFALTDGGNYLNMSAGQITMPIGTSAIALFREQNKVYQYIVCYNVQDSLYVGNPLIWDSANMVDTVIVNTINLCHSRYSNFAFNSFIRHNNRYYAACAKGIYELVGDSDFSGDAFVDTSIDAIILTPVSDFDTQEMKQVSDAYLHTRQQDDLLLDVLVNETDEFTDFTIMNDGVEGLHRHRVKLPRGLKGTDWQFRVRNTNGCDFSAFDLEIFVRKLKRVI
jgi:hypothetical protein